MAHGVNSRDQVRLNQTLHGYADGHRLLASSMPLAGSPAKTILALSDASGPTAGIDPVGYITGYPVQEAGLYALAKTWPALEMPRPGCVWTHTLLIDFADLASIVNFDAVAEAFRRPPLGQALTAGYEAPVYIDARSNRPVFRDASALPIIRRLLWALYSHPSERVVCRDGGPGLRERIVLQLWGQQWPRLRRSFSFCTSVHSDRSGDGVRFDLQFSSTDDRAFRSRFAKLLIADRESSDAVSWMEDALLDLSDQTAGSLREVLRELGAQVLGGRELFAPLCELHRIVGSAPITPDSISRAIAIVESVLASADAESIRVTLVDSIAARAEEMQDVHLRFAVRNLDRLSHRLLPQVEARLGSVLWSRDPRTVGEMVNAGNDAQRRIAGIAIASASRGALLEGLRRQPSVAGVVLASRRDLLTEPGLWCHGSPWLGDALRIVSDGLSETAPAINAMVEASNSGLATRVRDALGRESVLQSLLQRLDVRRVEEPSASEREWLSVSLSPNALARTLSDRGVREVATLYVIARLVEPDYVVNEFGEDPVFSAVCDCRGQLSSEARPFLASWLLARALGARSRSPAELISSSLDEVYTLVLQASLPAPCWSLLANRLPDSPFWGEWDRARRIRMGVINVFMDRGLSPAAFGQLLRDDALFAQFAREAKNVMFSRGYLKRVRRALRSIDKSKYAQRIASLR